MSLVSFNNVSKYYGSDLILDHISFVINKNEKIALIGNNGEGKTTILKLLLKEELPTLISKEDKPGEISIIKNLKIGYLNQNLISDLNNTVIEELLLVFKNTIKKEQELNEFLKILNANPNDLKLIEKYNNLLEEFKELRGYTYKSDIKNYLARFNFDESYYNKKISTLSGGERMKIGFIKLLLFNYDLLLLDEPTNYIDVSSIEWLENFIKLYKGTVLYISHDIYFIKETANKILELNNHKLTTYNTNYDNYIKLKEERYKNLLKESKKQDEEIEKLQRFITFYKPKPRFVSRAKDKEKKLEKILNNKVIIEKENHKNINIKLSSNNLTNKEILNVKDLVVGYDNKTLLKSISFDLYSNDKLAIMGDNGIGKSTLLKTIAKKINQISGDVIYKRKLNIGYFEQFDIDQKYYTYTIIEYLRSQNIDVNDNNLRAALGKFYFKGDDINKNISLLSNGEKKRVMLCDLTLKTYDLLLLDEPANHLDLDTKESLINSLKNYNGAIIFISHDRFFVNEIANKLLFLTNKNNYYIDGNYDDFLLQKEKLDNIYNKEKNHEVKIKQEFQNVELQNDNQTNKSKLSKNSINKINNEIKEIEIKLKEIEDFLNNANYNDYERIKQLQEEKNELEEKYVTYLEDLEKNT